MIRTPEQYIESLRDGRVVYQDGERVKDVPTRYRETAERMASEFWIANQPEYRSLFNMMEDGEEVSFSFKIPETGEDLQRRRTIIQTLNRNGIGGSRLTGIDGLNGIAYVTEKLDAAMGTKYAQNMHAYRAWCKKNDPSLCAAVSDPKGNRRLHAEDPKQAHKDFYVRIVDRNNEGIWITGCKLHISESILSNEVLVLPSRNHNEGGKDYCVACAVPCNAKGILFIGSGGQAGGGHPMVIFDKVFVPWERVFMAGEWQFSRMMATSFARYHRLTAATYKHVHLQFIAGLAMLMAEQNGLTHATRIQDMLAWLSMYADVTEAMGKAAALDPIIDPETGFAMPNPVYTNCAKYWFASQWHEAMKYLQDITGGIAATIPSMQDWTNPETRPYMEKYLQGDARFPTEERIRSINAVIRQGSTFNGVLSIHAEGSLATQRMVLYQMADWERFKAAARRSLGLATDHPDFKDLPLESPFKLPTSG
ncbi:MAG TPA: 4-hydroxyphenylacetate 3-hydroxylase N-terminal domain-containing protein [Dehalococcoidia bacterium]|nr:4-hydroxyphenylacetate 3-hydroxylase N-terminal domain-containing protein [Dehalococcoidia bacterium]